MKRDAFGVKGLDSMLKGGLIHGRPYVLAGPMGAGKTTLAFQFLLEGTRRGEPGLYIAVERPLAETMADMRGLGLDVGEIFALDANISVGAYEPSPVRDISSRGKAKRMGDRSKARGSQGDVSLQSIETNLRQEFGETAYARVVLDSLSGLRTFCQHGSDYHLQLAGFFRFMSDNGATSLMLQETPEVFMFTTEMRLAHGVLRMDRKRAGGKVERTVTISRMRGTDFDPRAARLVIDRGGIRTRE